jgi:N-acetylglucosamine kinase-like BadF-type ATPase
VTGELAAVLAIDGGNSKTDVALVAADGRLLGTARGPGAPPPEVGMDNAMAVFGDLAAQAARQAGMLAPGEPLGRIALHASACLAGADLPAEEAEIGTALAARGWTDTTTVRNDTFALLRAGATRPWGVAVVCGAGINCVGVGPDGAVARFLALGRFTGDWGGGMWLGEELLYQASRAEDGRGPDTLLRPMVAAHFGEPDVHGVCVALHTGRIRREELLGLTKVLFRAADEGDRVAVEVIDRQAEEVFLMARSALTRLGLLGSDPEVVLGGGVLAARHPLLVEGVESRLRKVAPGAVPRYGEVPPVAGAALLGLDRMPGGAEAGERLRAAYAQGPENAVNVAAR